MRHEYLREIFPNGRLPFPYSESDYHVFDERDTFNMDNVLIMWLYERLRYFEDKASKVVDLDFHTFNVDDHRMTQMQCIKRMIKDCKVILAGVYSNRSCEDFDKMDKAKDDLFKVLSKVYWAMWW